MKYLITFITFILLSTNALAQVVFLPTNITTKSTIQHRADVAVDRVVTHAKSLSKTSMASLHEYMDDDYKFEHDEDVQFFVSLEEKDLHNKDNSKTYAAWGKWDVNPTSGTVLLPEFQKASESFLLEEDELENPAK